MKSRYEHYTDLDDVLDRAGKLGMRALIFDVEPLVSWWDSGQESLDRGVEIMIGKVSMLSTVRVLVFATNSARRPSALPCRPPRPPPLSAGDLEVRYLTSAGKPVRTAAYRGLPRPGAVVGDQVPTDGLLARRLGFTFMHCEPRLAGVPLGPRLMHRLGQLALPFLFSPEKDRPTGHNDR